MVAVKARQIITEAPSFNNHGGIGLGYVKMALDAAEAELTEAANVRIRELVSRLMEYEHNVHDGERPEYFDKLEKKLLKENLL